MKTKSLPLVLLVAGALVLGAFAGVGAVTAADEAPAWRAKRTGTLEGVAMRRIGDMIEVSVWKSDARPDGTPKRDLLQAHEITEWTIESGDGKLLNDPETGRILFLPTGDETLIVRPRVGSLVGEPIVVGMNPTAASLGDYPDYYGNKDTQQAGETGETLPQEDGGLDAPGGGICGHRNGPRLFDEPVDVRSVVSISVIPISKTERVVRYAHGDYYSYHPDVGTMRIQYNPDKTSEIRLKSLSPTGEPFFPASAEGGFYFIIETLKDGYKMANWKPMEVEARVLEWPPFETPVINRDGVTFNSMERPEVELHRIAYQELYMYPTQELAVSVDHFEIKDGEMVGDFTLTNKTQNDGTIRWFVLGDVNEPITPTAGQVKMEAGSRTQISYRARVENSGIPQFITLGAVSESGARMVGFKRVTFNTSDWGGEKIALHEVSMERSQNQGDVVLAAQE